MECYKVVIRRQCATINPILERNRGPKSMTTPSTSRNKKKKNKPNKWTNKIGKRLKPTLGQKGNTDSK